MFGLIGMADARHNPIGGQLALLSKAIHIVNDRQQNRAAQLANPLDAGQIRVPLQLRFLPWTLISVNCRGITEEGC
jgi:hypothetical protein